MSTVNSEPAATESTKSTTRKRKRHSCLNCYDLKLRCDRPRGLTDRATPCSRCLQGRIPCLPSSSDPAATCRPPRQTHNVSQATPEGSRLVAATSQTFQSNGLSHLATTIPNKMIQPILPITEDGTAVDELLSCEVLDLYRFYQENLRPYLPIEPFGSLAADVCQQTSPIVFLAILNAAAGASGSPSSATINRALKQSIARHVIQNGEKTVDITLALLITVFWYVEDKSWAKSSWTNLMSMLSCLAYDQDMDAISCKVHGSAEACTAQRFVGCFWVKRSRILSAQEAFQQMRIFLALHCVLNNAALSTRRGDFLNMSPCIVEYRRILEQLCGPHDMKILQWTRLESISHNAAQHLTLIRHPLSLPIQSNETTERAAELLRDLEELRDSTGDARDLGVTELFYYHVVKVRILEFGLQLDSDCNLRPPYAFGDFSPPRDGKLLDLAISTIITALDTFCARTTLQLRCSPILSFSSVCYLCGMLIRCTLSMSHLNQTEKFGFVKLHASKITLFLGSLGPSTGSVQHPTCRTFADIISRMLQRFEDALISNRKPGEVLRAGRLSPKPLQRSEGISIGANQAQFQTSESSSQAPDQINKSHLPIPQATSANVPTDTIDFAADVDWFSWMDFTTDWNPAPGDIAEIEAADRLR